MEFQYSPYALPLFVSAAVVFGLAGYALRRREPQEARTLGWLMVAVGVWSVFHGISILGLDFETQVLFNRLKYIGVLATPPLWLILALQYTRGQTPLSRRQITLICLPGTLLLLVVLTDGWTHWWWPEMSLTTFDGVPALKRSHGFIYYVHIVLSYAYILGGLGLYIRFYRGVQRAHRRQAIMMVTAAVIPLVASIITNLGLTQFPWSLDVFFFTLSGILIAWAILRYRLLDIMPVARQTIVEQLPDGVIVIDAQGRVVDANPAARALVSVNGDALVGKVLLDVVPTPLRDKFATLLASETGFATTCDVNLPESAWDRVLSLQVSTLTRDARSVQGHIIVLQDITERVTVQRELEQLYQRAEAERERLALIISTAGDAIVLLGENNEILALNPAAQQILPAKTYADFPDALKTWLADVQGLTNAPTSEIALGEQTFHVAAAPIPGTGLVFTMHDITHFKELAHMKDEFVATVSHDLRSPLTSVKGYAQLAQREDVPDDVLDMALDRILTSAQRMNDLIDDLLDLAKVEAGLESTQIMASLDQLALDAIEDLEGAALQKGLTLAHDLAGIPETVMLPQRVAQVWHNLIGNAIKYTPSGAITVCTRVLDHEILGQVSDTGIGISSADIPYVFDKFFRAQNVQTETITGTGLGLTLVKSIVEQHGGRVWVESAAGKGSTFSFILPA